LLSFSESPRQWHQSGQFSGTAPTRPVVGADHAEYFVFPRIGPDFLETWAQVTAALADFVAGMWHAIAMGASPKEYACNIPLWLWKWTQGISAAGGNAPLASLIAQK